MRTYHFPDHWLGPATHGTYVRMVSDVMDAPVIHTNEWQSIDTSGSKLHGTHELEDVTLAWEQLPDDIDTIMPAIDHDWADDHFDERVSGEPLNPPPSATSWPYAVRGNGDHTDTSGAFDHTYPERFWPKFANVGQTRPNGRQVFVPHNGIRFEYGDLADVVALLGRSPLTRQAFLPVWFPEDTGANHGQRVPCTIGYHFMQRHGKLSCRYYIRSCDVYRHLSNDVYLAALLTRWVCNEVRYTTDQMIRFKPGSMVMHISSLHAFAADRAKIEARVAALPA